MAECADTGETPDSAVRLGLTYLCQRKNGTYRDGKVVKLRMNKRARREEYLVHYVGLTRRQAEWVDKTRLVLSKPVKEEDDTENGAEQKIADENSTQNHRSEEDEPEMKKMKVDMSVSSTTTTTTLILAEPVAEVKAEPLAECPEHSEKLKLFCTDDGVLCCVLCRDSLKHSSHRFLPIMDAVEVYRAELPAVVNELEVVLNEASELTNQQRDKMEALRNTITEHRQHIMSEFGNMYSFLTERKDKLLGQLQEQSRSMLEEMETNAAKLQKDRDSLNETITVVSQRVDETDVVSFLDGIQELLMKSQEQQEAVKASGNTVIEKTLCQGTFKSPIQYSTWKQMKLVVTVPKEIWIVGDGFMTAAKSQAETGPLGLNLGFDLKTCTVCWLSMRNYTLQDLFSKEKNLSGSPDIILFHADSNGLGDVDLTSFFEAVMSCFGMIEKLYPDPKFILSVLLPKLEWQWTSVEKFKVYLTERAQNPPFYLLRHDDLEKKLTDRYTEADNDSLTDVETDVFLSSIKDALQQLMFEDYKPRKRLQSNINVEPDEPSCGVEVLPVVIPDQPLAEKDVKSLVRRPRQIWIVENGFIDNAQGHKIIHLLKFNLGFKKEICEIQWWNLRSNWCNLFFSLQTLTNPDIILLHMGSYDLPRGKFKPLRNTVKNCLGSIETFFPNTEFILSTVLPKPEWLGTYLERRLDEFNSLLTIFSKRPRYYLLRHDELEKKLRERYRSGDRGSATDSEIDLFLEDIRCALQKAMFKDYESNIDTFLAEMRALSGAVPSKKVQSAKEVDSAVTRKDMDGENVPDLKISEDELRTKAQGGPTVVNQLEEVSKKASKLTDQQSEKIEQLKNTITECRQHIKSEFGNLCSFVKVQKKRLLEKLEDQNLRALGEMETNAANMEEQRNSLKEMVSLANQMLDEPHFVSFLNGIPYLIKRFQEQKEPSFSNTLIENQVCRGTFKGPIQYSTWKQIKSIVPDTGNIHQPTLVRKIEMGYKPMNPPMKLVPPRRKEPMNPPMQSVPPRKKEPMNPPMQPVPPRKEEPVKPSMQPVPPRKEEPINSPMQSLPPRKEEPMNPPMHPLPPRKEEFPEGSEDTPMLMHSVPKEIWMVGDLFMNAVNRQAMKGPLGCNLGFEAQTCTLTWLGLGKYSSSLFFRILEGRSKLKQPDIMFLHVGTDLSKVQYDNVITTLRSDLAKVTKIYPNTKIILSKLIPKPEWWNKAEEQQRKRYNSTIFKFVKRTPFHLLNHRELEMKLINRFMAGDLSSLTDAEIDLFLTSVREALQMEMCKVMYQASVIF